MPKIKKTFAEEYSEVEDKNGMREWLLGPDGHLQRLSMSVEQLARKIGVTRTSIYNMLADTNRPSPESLRKVCKVVGVSFEEGLKVVKPRRRFRPDVVRSKKPKTEDLSN